MKNRAFVTMVLLLFAVAGPIAAQNDDDDWLIGDDWLDQSDYEAFRQQSEKVFSDFRDSANARFARELAKQWQPVELRKPVERPHQPEPETPPVAPKPEGGRKQIPVPEKLPLQKVIPAPVEPPAPPRKMPAPEIPSDMMEATLPFYNKSVKLDVPRNDALADCTLPSTKEGAVSKLWQAMFDADVQACIERLMQLQERLHLNGWGMYDVTSRLAATMFPDDSRRVVATVFLLNQMEYDAKIARVDRGLACLLPLNCMVYATPYVTLDGKKYFIFLPDGSQRGYEGGVHTYACSMEGASLPICMDMAQTPLLPLNKSSRQFSRTVAGSTVEMCVNENLMDYYRGYPQVEMSLYANAEVDSSFKAAVDKWFAPMVEGKDAYDAVATLLNYMHFAFEYATDDVQFGYEKPFFCEENFYYPQNDCEDRSILFSYLVRYLLGFDVVLLDYPGHIATAVCFPEGTEVGGDYYMVDGKRFIVCDPTYIGADIGMAQPDYKRVVADIIKLRPVEKIKK